MKKIALLSILSLTMASCSYIPRQGQAQLVAEPDTVDLMLADAADRATRALETLSAMEQTQMPIKAVAAVPDAPQELQRAVTFAWTGPVEPLVEELSRKAGYRYAIIGAQPVTPILVNLTATNKPLINVFRDIGIQMGARGDLSVDAESRTIEIQYADFANRGVGQ